MSERNVLKRTTASHTTERYPVKTLKSHPKYAADPHQNHLKPHLLEPTTPLATRCKTRTRIKALQTTHIALPAT